MPKTFLFFFSLSFIISLSLRAVIDLNLDYYLIFCIILFYIYLLSKFRFKIISIIIFCLGFFLFSFQTDQESRKLGNKNFKAWVCVLPSLSLNSQSLILCPIDLEDESRIIIHTEIFPKYFYGDVLLIKAELKAPQFIEDFDYPMYLARNNIYRTISFPERTEKTGDKRGNIFLIQIYNYRAKMIDKINRSFSEPKTGLLKAMILGERKALSDDLNDKFRLAGLSHLVAVSGSHLSMVTVSFLFFGFFLSLRRQKLVYPLIIFLWVYLVLVGFRPSALRATIMYSLALIALKQGRLPEPLSILTFTACISLLINHFYLLDIAWQLSFLALFAIVNYLSISKNLIIRTNLLNSILQTFLLTFCIQAFLWPILVWHFGAFSLASLVSNLLVYLAFPLLIAFLLIFLISPINFISPSINLLADYFIFISKKMSQLDFLYLEFSLNSFSFLLIYYFSLLIIFWLLKKRLRK